MPERGPAQLLLLFLRSRAQDGWKLALAVACIALLGLTPGEEGVFHRAKLGLTQSLRQAAWKHALAGEPEGKPWPWDDVLPTPDPVVPRLGLSAAVLHDASGQRSDADPSWKQASTARRAADMDRRDPHLGLGDVAIGDRITVTTADGHTLAYQVTGRQRIDGQSPATEDALVAAPGETCAPQDSLVAGMIRLIIQAVHLDQAPSQAASDEQKL
jgi:sortase A